MLPVRSLSILIVEDNIIPPYSKTEILAAFDSMQHKASLKDGSMAK